MSSVIRLLPDHVANQIAAGEVVQRPASVVKELLENAVDAKATSIKLVVKDAGKTLIQVIDNGKGMNEVDARLCFERHATSKIAAAEDLFELQTKGFRGEALASIAAIAHVELKTKEKEGELGTHIIIEGSNVISQEVAVVPDGTSLSVKNLFFNIPARRNFLKSDQVELRHVIDEFERVALAHKDIRFVFVNNGSEIFHLPVSNMRQRIVNVFGGKTNEKLVPVQETTEIVEINGFVGKPEFAKRSRGEQFFFVNNRFIKSGYLHHAVTAAFEGLLRDGTHPSYFLYLKLPPNSIDINIHPTKTEIKFDDEQALYAILRATIKHSLGQFSVAPVLDFQKDVTLEVPYELSGKPSVAPSIQVDTSFNPFDEKKQSNNNLAGKIGSAIVRGGFNPFDSSTPETSGSKSGFSNTSFLEKKQRASGWETLYEGISDAKEFVFSSHHQIDEEEVTASLFDEKTLDTHATRQTYQLHKKYIISPIKSGLLIIDQRRAHQRILYDYYIQSFQVKQNASQQLLFPLSLYYSVYEMQLLKSIEGELVQMGFSFDDMTKEKIVILGTPESISESSVSIVLEDLLNDLKGNIPREIKVLQDRIAKSLAQSLAVKTGAFLSEKEQEEIVNSLFACENTQTSPFGKTTFITMKVEDIDKKFM